MKNKILSMIIAIAITLTAMPITAIGATDEDSILCHNCYEADCTGCLDIELRARAIWTDNTGWDDYYSGEAVKVRKDDSDKTYTLSTEVYIPQGKTVADLDCITNLQIEQIRKVCYGESVSGQENCDIDESFKNAAVTINNVTVDGGAADILDHYTLPWFIARSSDECLGEDCLSGTPYGCTPSDFYCPQSGNTGFAFVPVWYGWWKPWQLLQVGEGKSLQTKLMPADGNALSLTSNELPLVNFTVEFTLCFGETRCERCNGCINQNCGFCEGCTCGDFCGICGCAQ